MKELGIEEQPLDWAQVAREEAARWWRERIRQWAPQWLSRARNVTQVVAQRLQQWAQGIAIEGQAALEVVLDAATGLGRVAPEENLVRPDAGLEFGYAGAAHRQRLGLPDKAQESVAILTSRTLPGMRVIADFERRRVEVQLLDEPPEGTLLWLLPAEGPEPRWKEAALEVVFEDVPPGSYLLLVT